MVRVSKRPKSQSLLDRLSSPFCFSSHYQGLAASYNSTSSERKGRKKIRPVLEPCAWRDGEEPCLGSGPGESYTSCTVSLVQCVGSSSDCFPGPCGGGGFGEEYAGGPARIGLNEPNRGPLSFPAVPRSSPFFPQPPRALAGGRSFHRSITGRATRRLRMG